MISPLEMPVAILAGGLATRLRPVTEDDVAGVVAAFVAIDGHAAEPAATTEKFRDGTILNRQIRIAVEHKKIHAEQRQRTLERAAGAEQFGAVERIIKLQAKRRAVAKIALNHFAEMPDAEHGAADAARTEQFELVRQERFARDGNQRFGDFFRDGAVVVYDKKNRLPEMRHIDYGLSLFQATAFNAYPAGEPFDLAEVMSNLVREKQLAGYEVRERFYEIGSPAGLSELETLLKTGKAGMSP